MKYLLDTNVISELRKRHRASPLVRAWFNERIVDVDAAVADRWGRLGILTPLPDIDSLLAATALVHGMTVVTRNVRHIAPTGAPCLDPFKPAGVPNPAAPSE